MQGGHPEHRIWPLHPGSQWSIAMRFPSLKILESANPTAHQFHGPKLGGLCVPSNFHLQEYLDSPKQK